MEYLFSEEEEDVDTDEVFEDPKKDPVDEKIAEVPPEFEDSDEEDSDSDDPFEPESLEDA